MVTGPLFLSGKVTVPQDLGQHLGGMTVVVGVHCATALDHTGV